MIAQAAGAFASQRLLPSTLLSLFVVQVVFTFVDDFERLIRLLFAQSRFREISGAFADVAYPPRKQTMRYFYCRSLTKRRGKFGVTE